MGFRDSDIHARPKDRATLLPLRADDGTQSTESAEKSTQSYRPSGRTGLRDGAGADCERALLVSPMELAAKVDEEARRHAETKDDATHRLW